MGPLAKAKANQGLATHCLPQGLKNDIKFSSKLSCPRNQETEVLRYCVHSSFERGFLGAGNFCALLDSAC